MKRYNAWRHGRLRKDPNRQMVPTLGSSICIYYLHYTIWIPRGLTRTAFCSYFGGSWKHYGSHSAGRQVGRAEALPGMTMFAAQ